MHLTDTSVLYKSIELCRLIVMFNELLPNYGKVKLVSNFYDAGIYTVIEMISPIVLDWIWNMTLAYE